MPTASCSASPRRRAGSGSPTSSTRTSRSTRRTSSRCRTRSRAVYGEMLPRQPLRFLLADDPGAGKTIMAGLYIKELIVRGDLQRCLIVAPGQPGRAVAGRAVREVRPRVRHPHARHDRGVAAAATRSPSSNLADRPARPARRATRSCRRSSSRPTGTSSSSTRRTRCRAHFFGDEVKKTKRYQLGERLGRHHPPPAADDRDAAHRQGGGLPALPGAARPRPLRGQVPRRRRTRSTPRT